MSVRDLLSFPFILVNAILCRAVALMFASCHISAGPVLCCVTLCEAEPGPKTPA